MSKQKINEVKDLLKQMFWNFEDLENKEITPELVRQFFIKQVKDKILTSEELGEFAINVMDGCTVSFWERVEKLLWFISHKRMWANL